MATTAPLDLSVWRNDETWEYPLRVRGLDLTNVALAMQVRLVADTPGVPLVNLTKVTNANAEGLRVAGVTLDGGVPVTDLRIRLNKSTRQGLPYTGELGDATPLAHALLIGGRTRIVGSTKILAHAFGSDGAPSNRVPGYGAPAIGMPAAGATLTIAGDDVTEITIDGADLIAGEVDRAVSAGDTAEDARDDAQAAAATALATGRYFPTKAAGEGGSATGQAFTTKDGAGNLIAYERTSGGSTEIGRAVTPAALAAPDGAGRVGVRVIPGGVARTLEDRAADRVSVKDFGAVGDTVLSGGSFVGTDDTDAFQDAIDYAIANNIALDIPSGGYRITRGLTATFSGEQRGLLVQGASAGNLLGRTGSYLAMGDIPGQDALTVTAGNAQSFLCIEGVTFLGSGGTGHGIHCQNASYVKLRRCVLRDFAATGKAAVRFTGTSDGFVGVTDIAECTFQANRHGVWVHGDNANMFTFLANKFLDHLDAAVLFGAPGAVQQNRGVVVLGNTFEGNERDFRSHSSLHGLSIIGGYIENNNPAQRAPRIDIGVGGANPSSSCVTIEGVTFQKVLSQPGDALILLDGVDKGSIRRNFNAAGISQDRWHILGTNCAEVEFDLAHSPPGLTPPYPVNLSRTGPSKAVLYFSSCSSDHFVPLDALRIMGSGEAYPGANTTTVTRAFWSRLMGEVRVEFDITLSAKNGGSTGYASIGGLPSVFRGIGPRRFDLDSVTGISGSGPFHLRIAENTNFATVHNQDGTQVDLPTQVTQGARLKGCLVYPTN